MRQGRHFVNSFGGLRRRCLELKFSVVLDRLLDDIIDDALAGAVGHVNQYLPSGTIIDINAVHLMLRDGSTAVASAPPFTK